MSPRDRERNRDGNGWPIAAAVATMIVLFSSLSTATRLLGPASIPIWVVTFGGLAALGMGPIGKAFAARLHPVRDQPENLEIMVPPELYAELDELRSRVAELEERQDFSERLLSNRPEEKDHS